MYTSNFWDIIKDHDARTGFPINPNPFEPISVFSLNVHAVQVRQDVVCSSNIEDEDDEEDLEIDPSSDVGWMPSQEISTNPSPKRKMPEEPSTQNKPKKPRHSKHIRHACSHCQRIHSGASSPPNSQLLISFLACDGEKPCFRCIARGFPEKCIYMPQRRAQKEKREYLPEQSVIDQGVQDLFYLGQQTKQYQELESDPSCSWYFTTSIKPKILANNPEHCTSCGALLDLGPIAEANIHLPSDAKIRYFCPCCSETNVSYFLGQSADK